MGSHIWLQINWPALIIGVALVSIMASAQVGSSGGEIDAATSIGISDAVADAVPFKDCEREALSTAYSAQAAHTDQVIAVDTADLRADICQAALEDQSRGFDVRVPAYCSLPASLTSASVTADTPEETQSQLLEDLRRCERLYLSSSSSASALS